MGVFRGVGEGSSGLGDVECIDLRRTALERLVRLKEVFNAVRGRAGRSAAGWSVEGYAARLRSPRRSMRE